MLLILWLFEGDEIFGKHTCFGLLSFQLVSSRVPIALRIEDL